MTCEKLTLSAFEWVRSENDLLITLFYHYGEKVDEIKYALERVENTLGGLQTRVCMVDVSRNATFASDYRIDKRKTPKIVLFIGGDQVYGFSALANTGEPLTAEEISSEIEKRLEQIENS